MNAGLRVIAAPDPVLRRAIPIRILYPTTAPARTERFGPYALEVAIDAPLEGADLPLVLVSHGNGSTGLALRGLAAHLARAGFVVALVDHPGNMRGDNDLQFTAANLENRPRQARLALDAVLAEPMLQGRVRARAGMIGHSMGGYTALALAGGRPAAFPSETPDGRARPVPVTPDPRIAALVLLTPGASWFKGEGALAAVTAPILLVTAAKDEITPAFHGEIVVRGVPDIAQVEHSVVDGGGHFAVQTPFPPEMVSADFPPSQDPAGFDRAAYQETFLPQVEAFLRRRL